MKLVPSSVRSTPWLRRALIPLAAGAAVALSLSACGGSGGGPLATGNSSDNASSGGTVAIGSADFPESQVIAFIYSGALEAAGVKTNTSKMSIGSREVYLKALGDGSIDLIPDYTGNLLLAVDPSNTATDKDAINKALPEKLGAKDLAVLDPSSAEDKDSMVVTKATAEKYKLSSLEDLGKVCDQLTIAGPPEFETRAYGLPGLKKNYNCTPKAFKPITGEALTVKALTTDDVQVADIFSTSPAISDNALVTLSDPKNNILANQVVPLYTKGKLNDAATQALNDVSKKLTTDDLVNLNRDISGDKKLDPKEAAQEWLKSKGITK